MKGRDRHVINMGGITEIGTSFPGNTGVPPDYAATCKDTA